MKFAQEYYSKLFDFMKTIEATDKDKNVINFDDAIEKAKQLILSRSNAGSKLAFIGNGASQAISSHLSTDFWKNGGVRAIAFTDPALLTCIGNDYGYPQVFAKPVEMFADPGDILVAISSSGQSENILNACQAARKKECQIISLSGFKPDNPLKALGDINFYVSAKEYGVVEVIHHSILHCIIDNIINSTSK